MPSQAPSLTHADIWTVKLHCASYPARSLKEEENPGQCEIFMGQSSSYSGHHPLRIPLPHRQPEGIKTGQSCRMYTEGGGRGVSDICVCAAVKSAGVERLGKLCEAETLFR